MGSLGQLVKSGIVGEEAAPAEEEEAKVLVIKHIESFELEEKVATEDEREEWENDEEIVDYYFKSDLDEREGWDDDEAIVDFYFYGVQGEWADDVRVRGSDEEVASLSNTPSEQGQSRASFSFAYRATSQMKNSAMTRPSTNSAPTPRILMIRFSILRRLQLQLRPTAGT